MNKASPPTPLLKERVDRVEDERREWQLFDLHSLKLKDRAKALRKSMTPAEKILWKEIRAGKFLRYKFRRQFPIDNYIVDFFCFEKLLAIELDGSHHLEKDIVEYDRIRTIHLEAFNITVLRFQNYEVKKSMNEVLTTIFNYLQKD